MTGKEINEKIEKMLIEPIYTMFPFVSIKIAYMDSMRECELRTRWYVRGEICGYNQIIYAGIIDDENDFKDWSMYVAEAILSKITKSVFERGEE